MKAKYDLLRCAVWFCILILTGVVLVQQLSAAVAQNDVWEAFDKTVYGQSISMVSETDGWMLFYDYSSQASLYRWNGTAWTNGGTLSHSQDILRGDIHMVSATDGWVVLGGPLGGSSNLSQSTVYRWNGSNWVFGGVFSDPNAVSMSAIDMVSSNDGWIAASFNFGSHFYHWNGVSWQKMASVWLPAAPDNDIAMVSATDGWAVGFTGHIARWNGATWATFSQPVTTSLNSIDMVSSTDGWIVGHDGVILRWNGTTWNPFTSPTTEDLHAVDFASASDGWAAGSNGVILHWDGSAWTEVTSPTSSRVYDIDMLTPNFGWAASGAGVLRYVGYQPALEINYAGGAPGSFFTLTGSGYPPDSAVDVAVNGRFLGAHSSDSNGEFEFLLKTVGAEEGTYFVEASTNPTARQRFVLDTNEPVHPQDGSGPVFEVPEGIAFTEFIYLPAVMR